MLPLTSATRTQINWYVRGRKSKELYDDICPSILSCYCIHTTGVTDKHDTWDVEMKMSDAVLYFLPKEIIKRIKVTKHSTTPCSNAADGLWKSSATDYDSLD